jgi:hypothetical protein
MAPLRYIGGPHHSRSSGVLPTEEAYGRQGGADGLRIDEAAHRPVDQVGRAHPGLVEHVRGQAQLAGRPARRPPAPASSAPSPLCRCK